MQKFLQLTFANIAKKKRRKMRNEMNETLIFYLTKRSVSSSLFHFVISALAFMSSLDELGSAKHSVALRLGSIRYLQYREAE